MVVLEILRNIFLVPLELIFEAIFTLAFNITHSEGVAIILLSLVVSTLVLPLYKRAEKIETEQREKEKELSHWVDHIKKTFKGDEKYMILDAYYRENHYNPIFQLKSSISLLLQIPFFSAAYDLLGVRAAQRFSGTGFFAFYDLGAPDRLFSFGTVTINALPLLMTMVNLLATYIYTKDLPIKTVIRSLALPIVFLLLLYNSPSALLLYWTMNNIYSLVKTIIIKNSKANKSRNKGKSTAKTEAHSAFGKAIDSFLDKKANTGVFILSAAFMSVLTGLLIPLAYLSTSPAEFISSSNPMNPLHYLISSFFISVGFFVLWPSVFYYLANNKIRNLISIFIFGASVFSAINYLFFGTDTGTINTTLIFDKDPSFPVSLMVINAAIVLAILIVGIFLYRFKKVLNFVLGAAIMTMLTISFINAKKVQDTYSSVIDNIAAFQEDTAPKIQLSSSGQNVMVIMLDRAISGYIPYILNECPDLQEKLDGFVYYPNTISFGQNTLKSSSALFGGYEYTPERMDARSDETLAEKHDEAYRVLPVLFSNQGYSVTLMDLPFPGWSWSGDYSAFEDVDNCFIYHAKDYFTSDTEAHVNTENRRNRNLFMYSLFRCAPLCLQEFIYDGGDYLSVGKDAYNIYDLIENYKVLENFEGMTQISDDYPGSLFLIDNETTHDVATISNYDPYTPYEFDDGYTISDGENEIYIWDPLQAGTYECLVAALYQLGDYMDYLRANGVYDNTRIIIVSDHGYGVYLFEDLISEDFQAEWYNCLLMVKDFDSTGFTTDYTFMTNADVPTLALEGIVDNPVNPGTGNPINSDLKYDDIYVGFSLTHDEKLWNPEYNLGSSFYYDDDYKWFQLIDDDIFVQENWVETEYPLNND